ncbi:MAG: hypothetical protein AB7F98_17235 [Novosphingobium sp.]
MKNVFGGIMLGCGILIAGTAGSCAVILLTLFPDTKITWEGISVFGPPIGIGIVLAAIGSWLIFGLRSQAGQPSGQAQPATPPDEIRRAAPPADPPDSPG